MSAQTVVSPEALAFLQGCSGADLRQIRGHIDGLIATDAMRAIRACVRTPMYVVIRGQREDARGEPFVGWYVSAEVEGIEFSEQDLLDGPNDCSEADFEVLKAALGISPKAVLEEALAEIGGFVERCESYAVEAHDGAMELNLSLEPLPEGG